MSGFIHLHLTLKKTIFLRTYLMSKKNVEFLNEFSGRLLIFFLLLKTGSGAVLWANLVCPEGPSSV